MILSHLVLGQSARPHAFIEAAKMHAIHMPDDDGQHRQNGFAAVGGLGCRDELAREHGRRRDRVPHHEAGDYHHHCAPHKSPVFGFFLVSIPPALRLFFAKSKIEKEGAKRIGDVAHSREHGEACTLDEGAIAKADEVIDGFEHQHDGGDVMDLPRKLDAAHGADHRLRPPGRAVLLRQARNGKDHERSESENMLNALGDFKSRVGIRAHFLPPLIRAAMRRPASAATNTAIPPTTAGMKN